MVIFMVPAQLAAIPQFVIMAKLGWIGTMTSLIVPAAANAFGIFWMRQYMKGAIHDELLDASRIDGANFLRQYWHVALPVVRPGRLPRHLHLHGTVERLRLASDRPHQPGQRDASGRPVPAQRHPWHHRLRMVMTGALLALVPLLIVFAIGARQIIADLGKGAIR